MTATAEPPVTRVAAPAPGTETPPLHLADGAELLGAVHGSGYREGAALVRRRDGQMVQLGPLMYALLECVDGQRDVDALATAMSERMGRRVDGEHVVRLAEKLSAQGLLAGTEHLAPPRSNPLLALRWKVLVTDPVLTRRLTAPFTFLFRPWVMVPVVVAFLGVFWFVLIHKGVAAATAQAFHSPGYLLLVFALAIASAAFHEIGHASACRYGGAAPAGMGMGLYVVWPAFYTDVTEAYRLPRRDRLRTDLGGLYFNAIVAVVTLGVWLVWHVDALLLLVALQVLEMVKQLSPVIRADGYHILADATGVPDLYAHIGPTMRRLLPWRRQEPSALTGRARLLVTAWVLIIVPILLSLMFSAILLLPRLATSAWDSGHHILTAIPTEAGDGHVLTLLALLVRLVALALPVLGSVLVSQRFVRLVAGKARAWSDGDRRRRALVMTAGAAAAALLAWAWWPSGQYQPVPSRGGTLVGLTRLISAPQAAVRPTPAVPVAQLTPGTHLALTMIPVGGASARHPAVFVVSGGKGKPPVMVLSDSARLPGGGSTSSAGTAGATTGGTATSSTATPVAPSPGASTPTIPAAAFPFTLPSAPGPGGTQAVAVGTKDGGVTYKVAYSLLTVRNGAPVTESNSAFALAHCRACTTVAVSFQVILIVGESHVIAPIDAAGSLNYACPACSTTAIADQIVATLKAQPSQALLAKLQSALQALGALPQLGAGGTPTAVAAEVATVQNQIATELNASGLLANSSSTSTAARSASTTTSSSTTTTTPAATTTTPAATTTSPAATSTTTPSATTTTSSTTTPSTTSTTSSTTPAAQSTTAPTGQTTTTRSSSPTSASSTTTASTTTTTAAP